MQYAHNTSSISVFVRLGQIFPQQPNQTPAVCCLRKADHFLHTVFDGADGNETVFGNVVIGFFPQQAVDDLPIQAVAFIEHPLQPQHTGQLGILIEDVP